MMEIVVKVPYIDNVVAQVKKHKTIYISCGIVAIAGITLCIMRRTAALGGAGDGVALGGTSNTASFSFMFRSPQKINITTVLDREGRGHPGWPVRNLESKKVFLSQRETAKIFDIPEGKLSGHLKGRYPDVDGLHFQRVNLAPL